MLRFACGSTCLLGSSIDDLPPRAPPAPRRARLRLAEVSDLGVDRYAESQRAHRERRPWSALPLAVHVGPSHREGLSVGGQAADAVRARGLADRPVEGAARSARNAAGVLRHW